MIFNCFVLKFKTLKRSREKLKKQHNTIILLQKKYFFLVISALTGIVWEVFLQKRWPWDTLLYKFFFKFKKKLLLGHFCIKNNNK